MKIQQTFIPHFPKLQRKSAALHREVIRKLLSGKGNIEFIFSEPLCLCGKIGHQLCARCALPHVRQLFAEAQVFLRKLAKQISDDMVMMRAGGGTHMQHTLYVQIQHRNSRFRHNAYIQHRAGRAGIGGGNKENGGNITINGGTIIARGSGGGAGIGGGYVAKNNSNQITIKSNENGSPTVNAVGGSRDKTTKFGGAGIGAGGDSTATTDITLEGKVTINATAGKDNAAIGANGIEQEFPGLAGGTSITRKDSDKNDISPLPGDNVPDTDTPSGGGSTGGDSTGGDSAGGDSAGGGSSGGGSADASVQESVFPGLVVTDKDGQRISYTSIRDNNVLSLRVGRFTASLRASLSTLRQLRAEGIDTITFQTILCSTTLSVDELLAMGGEDAEVVLTHHIRSSTLTVGGRAV